MGNTRSIQSEDFFFFLEIAMMLGEKSEGRNQSLFFLENINFWKFLPRTPELEYLSLLSVYLDMPHCPQCVTQTHDGNHFHSYTCRGGGRE